MRKIYLSLFAVLLALIGCQWHLKPTTEVKSEGLVSVERFDRAERLYLTTGDIAALQQMKTAYPGETRILIEDVLHLGMVDEPDINVRFLHFFQDSTLQQLIGDVDRQYADMSDINEQLTEAFDRLHQLLPRLKVPRFYTQIGSLDQSVIVSDSMVGISLDKYLGSNHPVYLRYGYTPEQRRMMTRQYIVPDCLGFYLLGHYPMPPIAADSFELRHQHMVRIQYVVNQAMRHPVFTTEEVKQVESFMFQHPAMTIDSLLRIH